MARPKKYNISLTDDELKELKSVMRKKQTTKTVRNRCQIIIDLDEAHGKVLTHAQTGNVMEMAAALTGKNFAEVGIRFLAFLIFGSAIVISYLLTNFTKLDMRKLVLWVDAAGLTVTAMMPEGMSAVVSLYPIFFCSAFQWGSYSGASGYNSASIFTTNNFKQSLLAWTQFVLTKDPEFRRKGIMYTMTVS